MTVVLCGSLGSTAEMWEPQRAALRDPVTVEYPGHGSEPTDEVDGIAGLGGRVLAAVDGRFDFVGLSLGGAVGIWLAARHPERVGRLVLACTSARFGDPAQWHERAALVRSDGLEAIAEAVTARWLGEDFPERERWQAMFVSVDREGYARCCEALAEWDGTPLLAEIGAPTLVIAGSEDPTSPPAEADAIAERIGGARVAVIEGARHLANVGRPAEFNRLLEEFL